MDLKKIQAKLEEAIQTGLRKVGVTASGSSFFGGARKGESAELQADLNSTSKTKQSNALKRIIANMSLGRDVSQLFADVVKLGQSPNLEVKKLVYLYVLSNARLQPEKALLAVNTFLIDCHTHASPTIRALAIRTMLCLRTETVLDYLIEPLKKALTVDGDPYVKKTAAIGVLKLFHQNPKVMEDHGFLPILVNLVTDANHVVASNAAAALYEIIAHRSASASASAPVALPAQWANKLLHTLPECSEWGQVYILDLLSGFHQPADDQVEMTIERVIPRLSHANAAVVLATVKYVLQLIRRLPSSSASQNNQQAQGENQKAQFLTRVNNALLTLSRSDPETQFVVIKNIQALLPIFPGLLRDKIDGFFVRFNDPLCVKKEKLRLLMMLMHQDNASLIVKELEEYATDVDMAFLAKVIHAIAISAIKQETVVGRCVKLLHSIADHQPEMIPDIFIAAKNLLRRHPQVAQELMTPLLLPPSSSSSSASSSTASASASATNSFLSASISGDLDATVAFVWILGEFCDVLPNGMAALDHFTSNFSSQESTVQNSVMTALVKLFLRNPAQVEPLLTPLFENATKTSCDPDVRDRAFMYWRLLAKGIGIEKMKQLVRSGGSGSGLTVEVDDRFSNKARKITATEVLTNLNTAATVLERSAKTFLLPYGLRPLEGEQGGGMFDEDEDHAGGLPGIESEDATVSGEPKKTGGGGGTSLDDIFSAGSGSPPPQKQQQVSSGGGGNNVVDIFAGSSSSASANTTTNTKPTVDPFAQIGQAPSPSSNTNKNNTQGGALDSMFGGGTNTNSNKLAAQFDPFAGASNATTTNTNTSTTNTTNKPASVDDLFA